MKIAGFIQRDDIAYDSAMDEKERAELPPGAEETVQMFRDLPKRLGLSAAEEQFATECAQQLSESAMRMLVMRVTQGNDKPPMRPVVAAAALAYALAGSQFWLPVLKDLLDEDQSSNPSKSS
jgi:hypothetical protein